MKNLFFLAPVFFVLAAFSPSPKNGTHAPEIPADIKTLLDKHTCTSCHAMDKKLVGPSWLDIAAKGYTKKKIVALVKKPEPANWPNFPPMAAQPTIPGGELNKMAAWLEKLKP